MSISFSLLDCLVLTAFVRRIVSSCSPLLVVSIRTFGNVDFVKVFVFMIVFEVVSIKGLEGDEDPFVLSKVVRGGFVFSVITTGVFTLSVVSESLPDEVVLTTSPPFVFGSMEDILISVTFTVGIIESVVLTVSPPIATIGSEVVEYVSVEDVDPEDEAAPNGFSVPGVVSTVGSTTIISVSTELDFGTVAAVVVSPGGELVVRISDTILTKGVEAMLDVSSSVVVRVVVDDPRTLPSTPLGSFVVEVVDGIFVGEIPSSVISGSAVGLDVSNWDSVVESPKTGGSEGILDDDASIPTEDDTDGWMGSEPILVVTGTLDVSEALITPPAALIGFSDANCVMDIAAILELLGVGRISTAVDSDVDGPSRSPSPHPSSLSQLLLFVAVGSPDPS